MRPDPSLTFLPPPPPRPAQIETASVAYGRQPDFPPYPAGQDRCTWDRVLEHLVQESLEDGYEERKRAESQKIQR